MSKDNRIAPLNIGERDRFEHDSAPEMARYASWWSRAKAYLFDRLIVPLPGWMLFGFGVFLTVTLSESVTVLSSEPTGAVSRTEFTDIHVGGVLIMVSGIGVAMALEFWNMVVRQGTVAQSVGKSRMGISTVRESDRKAIGKWRSFLRWMLSGIFTETFLWINFLWPFKDKRNRCWHDMAVSTIVIEGQPSRK